MRKSILALPLAFLVSSASGEMKPAADSPVMWIFLNSGPGKAKTKEMPAEAVKQMQADHVGNFGTLFDQGKLFIAGPLGDNGSIRGIAVLNASNQDEIKACFKPDPFVQNEILEIEPHAWQVDMMSCGPPKVPFQMAEYTLCIVKKGNKWET